MTTMKALVVEGPKQFVYQDIPVPALKAGEVLVKVRACGICGSDVPRVRDGGVHSLPQIVGHEFSGDVVAVGEGVSADLIGLRAAVAPLVPCGHCDNCAKGRPAMCTEYSFIGSRQPGAMTEYVAVPAKNLVAIDDGVTYEQAACIEPITVAIHGVERAGELISGSSAIVYGCGTIGILTMQVLQAKGIERVYVIDINQAKLDLAKKLGAYEVINSQTTDVPAYFKEKGLADYAFETAGVNFLQAQLPELVKKTGTIVYIGTVPRDVTFKAAVFEQILRGELLVTGSWMSYSSPFPGGEWRGAAEYLKSGKIAVDDIITHKFPLSAGYEAFETLFDLDNNALKVMYVMD